VLAATLPMTATPSAPPTSRTVSFTAEPTPARRADFGSALKRASQILTTASHTDRVVYVVTDLQATGWEGALAQPDEHAAGSPSIVIVDVGGAWENRAVVSLTAEPAPQEGVGAQGVAVIAEVANFSDEPANKLGLTLRLDGSDVARASVDVPAHGRVRKRFLHTLSGAGTAHEVEIELDHDLFTLDDSRPARVAACRRLRILPA